MEKILKDGQKGIVLFKHTDDKGNGYAHVEMDGSEGDIIGLLCRVAIDNDMFRQALLKAALMMFDSDIESNLRRIAAEDEASKPVEFD